MSTIWSRSRLIAYPASLVDFAKFAAPLLTGFSLTAVVAMVGRDQRGVRGDLAIMSFSLAATLLIFAIQAGLTAATYQASPADRVAWTPEARGDDVEAVRLRQDQWDDEILASRYRTRTQYAYNFGIVWFLAGLVCLLVPAPGGWSVPRIVGIVAACLAVAIELVGLTGWPPPARRLLSPTLEDLARERSRRAEFEPASLTMAALQQAIGDNANHARAADRSGNEEIASRLAEIKQDIAGG
jgi:hypothetical protein